MCVGGVYNSYMKQEVLHVMFLYFDGQNMGGMPPLCPLSTPMGL